MFLVIALGNYGEKYATTRHNAAWLVVDEIVGNDTEWGFSKYANAEYFHDVVGETAIEYFKPHTMMNLSGQTVAYAAEKHNIKPQKVIVIHDDIDIAVGEFKISFNRGSANHNGVESVEQALASQEYIRIRVGIGNRGPIPLASYVLMQLPEPDQQAITSLAPDIAKALRVIVEEGVEKAMNEFN